MKIIGTLNEKSIHRYLKAYYEPDESRQEIRVCGYIADIQKESSGEIIEIQTKQFDKLRDKLKAYTDNHYKVNIVYPVSVIKYVNWINPVTREIDERRKSPGRTSVHDIFVELYKIRDYLEYKNITFTVVALETEEYKYLDGYGINGKNRATKIDKLPTKIIEEITFGKVGGYEQFIPDTLKTPFTSNDFAKSAKCKIEVARTTLLILSELGIVQRVGKESKRYLYTTVT